MPASIVGAVSALFWALMLVVTLKYVLLILRADNRGEGGGLALTASGRQAVQGRLQLRRCCFGVFGATLFYGDSVITPAISVIGAMEGLKVFSPLAGLGAAPVAGSAGGPFVVQRHGTHRVGRVFGPVIVLWFAVLAVTGALAIAANARRAGR